MARPKKYDIDTNQVAKLASYSCTNIEIADFFGCSPDLLEKSYSKYLKQGRFQVKLRLRKAQIGRALGDTDKRKKIKDPTGKLDKDGKPALIDNPEYGDFLNNGSVPMLIWLGKQMLGQTENPIGTEDELCEGFEIREI